MQQDNPRLGIILVVSGLCIAAYTGALMKQLSETMSAYQITWFRFLGFVIILLPIVIARFGKASFRPARLWMQVIRGLTMATATSAFVIGAKTTDFADAIAILYAYPFLLTILAVLFLNERVGVKGWLGVTGGFIGVVLVMRPGFGNIDTGSLFVFLCAVIVSVQLFLNRKLGASSHPMITCIWGASVATILLIFCYSVSLVAGEFRSNARTDIDGGVWRGESDSPGIWVFPGGSIHSRSIYVFRNYRVRNDRLSGFRHAANVDGVGRYRSDRSQWNDRSL